MIKLDKLEKCSGCHACSAVCPKNCIEMISDAEGFLYPKVREEDCVKCGLCEKICPIINRRDLSSIPEAYAIYSLDDQNREKSSSGGVFPTLASYVLQQGGVVFGAAFTDNFEVEHCYVERIEDLERLQGSKYVQSRIGDAFQQAKVFLENGRIVYFSGTPCQVSGLKNFLGKIYPNLITQDVICHGVPSPKVWQKYISQLRVKLNKDISMVRFRDKMYGWENYSLGLYSGNKLEFMQVKFQNVYMLGFLNNLFLRPSCYKCAFKTDARVSDISLADFWGSKQQNCCQDDKGLSLVLVHSTKGKELLGQLKDKLYIKEVAYEQGVAHNGAMTHSAKMNANREIFFMQLENKPIIQLLQKYTKPSFPLWVFRQCKIIGLKMRRKLKRIDRENERNGNAKRI